MELILEYIKRNNRESIYSLFNIDNSNMNINKIISDTLIDDFPNKNNITLINDTLWLGEYKYYYFGLYKEKIISFSEDGAFQPFCLSLCDLPFELLRRESQSFDYNGILKEENVLENLSLFKKEIFQHLKDYLNFLKLNNLSISDFYFKDDRYRFLYEYFQIDYSYDDFNIKNLEGKIFLNIE